jgi:hypothetical protein
MRWCSLGGKGMNVNKIETGKYYRLKNSPGDTYVKPVEIIRPGTWQMKELAKNQKIKPFKFIVIKCEHVVNKNDSVVFVRYFRTGDIVEEQEEGK